MGPIRQALEPLVEGHPNVIIAALARTLANLLDDEPTAAASKEYRECVKQLQAELKAAEEDDGKAVVESLFSKVREAS
jgi:TorA maturation chaperone TorD